MSTIFQAGWSESGPQDPFAMTVYNGNLFFFGQYLLLHLNYIDLDCLNYDATLPSSIPTSSLVLSNFVINSQYTAIRSESPSACSAIALGGFLCLFWNDTLRGVCTAVCDATSALAPPRPWFQLQDSSGTPLIQNVNTSYDITATPLDASTLLVATHRNVGGQQPVVYIAYYRLNDRVNAPSGSNDPGTWSAYADWTVAYNVLAPSCNPSNIGTSLAMDWYSYGVPETPTDPPTTWLGVALFETTAPLNGYIGWLPVDVASPGSILIGGCANGQITTPCTFNQLPSSVPLRIKRDPGGFMRVYSAYTDDQNNQNIWVYLIPGTAAPTPELTGDEIEMLMTCVPASSQQQALQIDLPIVPAFFTATDAMPTTISSTDPGWISGQTVIAYPAAEAIFAHSSGQLNYYSSEIGRVQTLSDIVLGATPPSSVLAIRGIFDGPFPAPGAQLIPYFGTNTTYADVKYGTLQQGMQTRQDTFSFTLGVRAGVRTSKGFGPAFEAAASATYNTFNSLTTGTATMVDLVQSLVQDPDSHNIAANGTVFGTVMAITASACRFLVPDPNNSGYFILQPLSPVWALIWAAPAGATNLIYDPYAVVPGDISTYTMDAWNQTMQQLGYPDGTYFQDIILANAFVFPDTGLNYIEIPVSIGSQQPYDTNLSTITVNDMGWGLDASVYGGVSGDITVDIFGVGVGMEFEFLLGIEDTFASSTSLESSESWGISVENVFLPPPSASVTQPDGTNGVTSYTVRLYLLPPSQLWTQELLAFAPDIATRIDPTSSSWRIVYQVTQYQLSNGVVFPPAQTPPAPTTAPSVNLSVMEYPSISYSVWANKPSVQYYVAFANAGGQSPGPPSTGAAPTSGACPQVTIPVDPSSPALTTSRILYRSFNGGPFAPVKTIFGNDPADNTTYDDDPAVNFIGPTPSFAPPGQWAGRATGASPVWTPGVVVSYAVAFTFEPPQGASQNFPVAWLPESQLSTNNPSQTIGLYANCVLSVPTFPEGAGLPTCTGRNIYRTAAAGPHSNPFQTNVFVGRIIGNSETVFTDNSN